MTATILRQSALPTAVWSDWSCLVRVVVSRPDALEPAVADVTALMLRVERAASRFLVESDVCWANANAGRPVAVSRTLVNLVVTALEAARRSNGAVDPTLARDLRRVGYDRDIALIGHRDDPVESREVRRFGWQDVQIDREVGLLVVPRGLALDLGATAKAQTADWAAHDLADRYDCGVLVEIGGDVAVAGTRNDWQIAVAERAGEPAEQVTLPAGGLATSTTLIRRWQRGGRTWHHILDPATGEPATGPWRTVTVAADSAAVANTCSTAAIVLGENAVPWLTQQAVAARLVHQDGSILRLGGWPPVLRG